MNCHEGARAAAGLPAVAICRYCSVGLCKVHLVDTQPSWTKPLYACLHMPEPGVAALGSGSTGSQSPAPHSAA